MQDDEEVTSALHPSLGISATALPNAWTVYIDTVSICQFFFSLLADFSVGRLQKMVQQ